MKKTNSAVQGWLLVSPLLIGCLLFYVLPSILVFYYSLKQQNATGGQFLYLGNYQNILSSNMFWLAFGNTMRFLVIGLPLIMVLAYSIALLMQKQADRHKLLKSVFLFPYMIPVVGTVVLVDLLFAEKGLVPNFAEALSLPMADWLNGPGAFLVVLLLYLWKNTGYSVVLLLAGLVTIPQDQYESADMDGASAMQKFLYITTPQMWYSVFFALIFSLINAFKCFREIFIIGGVYPNENIFMLQHILNNSFEKMDLGILSAASVLFLGAVLILFAALYVFVRRMEAFCE